MFTIKEKQRVDRELFSELLESPVYSAFLNMTRPLRGSLNPLFYLRINGKALREWRRLKNPDEVFDALQCNLRRIGYTLSSCCRARVGKAVHSRVEYTVKKVNQASNGNIRRAVKSNYWASLSLLPEEPDGMIEELLNRQQELVTKNQRLRTEIEGNNISILSSFETMQYICHQPKVPTLLSKWTDQLFYVLKDKASQLYDAMVKHTLDGHKGRATEGVGRRQQQRHLKEIRLA